MIEQWILDKIEPHKRAPLIILRDPQRVIQPGAHVVDGWGEENGFAVLFCAGKLALREMYEAIRADAASATERADVTQVLVVDRSKEDARIPLFYPDLSEASLQGLIRCEADLSGSNLRGADLSEANLPGANLRGAIVPDGQLAQAASVKGATLPDGSVHECYQPDNKGIAR